MARLKEESRIPFPGENHCLVRRSSDIQRPPTQRVRINKLIRASEVRLISDDGQQLGVMPLKDALAMATEAHLDLVEVAPQANPPVCRIMDYGKFKYQQSKKQQEARRRQTTIQVKEDQGPPQDRRARYGL